MLKPLRILAIGSVLGLASARIAAACAFHGYTPDPTLVDVLLSTEQVVIARLSDADAERYTPVTALMGPAGVEIDLPVSADIRTHLLSLPETMVLLARDGAYGPWLELATLDPDYRSVIDHVLAYQSKWLLGGDAQRAQYFAGLVNAPNPDLRDLALRELDRAPYGILKGIQRPAVDGL